MALIRSRFTPPISVNLFLPTEFSNTPLKLPNSFLHFPGDFFRTFVLILVFFEY
jgi:hypothetical protein